ncbi:uncharacterized protein LOC129565504 [Sitodiplosis mosellana]|uniref:uncharacterized protein LOC129565504 n=1 Tax=Sitodiplosis mosellana TaxID=263140 RepID=UPI002443C476|nr:uncharacterized protein LOC129565504 [Sitodiplosis mosellana]
MDRMMKIIEMNVDCLEKVLECLNFIDLLNAADSNKQLNHAATLIFNRKYGKKKFIFGETRLSPKPLLQSGKYFIDINDLRTGLKCLRCFGAQISEMVLYRFQEDVSEFDLHIIAYINEYCAEAITRIGVRNCSEDGLKYFTTPFTKVEDVYLQSCSAEKEWIKRVFPKVRELKLCPSMCSTLLYNGCTASHFPRLEHLEISSSTTRENIACRKNVMATLRLNPQLKTLRVRQLCTPIDLTFFQESSGFLQNLENLELTFSFHFFHNFNGAMVHLKSVKHLEIYGFDIPEVHPIIPFSFDKLESLSLSSYGPLDERFYEFIEKHPSIKELKITNRFPNEEALHRWRGIAKVLPLLQSEMDFSWIKFSVEEALDFMQMFKSLKSFRFGLNQHSDYQHLQMRLNVGWLVSINEYNIVQLERRILKI